MSVRVEDSHLVAQMLCHTSCLLEAPFYFEWQKNGVNIKSGTKVEVTLSPGDYITCAARQQQQHISISPHLYVLKRPSVSLSPIGDILEGRPLTLTCDIDNYDYSSATYDYCWYKKKNVSSHDEVLSKGRQLVFQSIKSSYSAEYWCTVENQLGKKTSEPVFVDVQYAPKRPYVSVVQSNELAAGSLVNLTCSSDANPAASYTWYKENMSSPLASGQTLTIKDISPGQTLTIKDISSGQTLTIKDISPGQMLAIRNVTEQGGHDYYCEANNSRGRHIIGVHVSVNGMSCRTINIIRLFCSAVVFVGILIILTLEFRTTSPSSTADPNELVETVEELDPGDYENIDAEDSL
ncbi:B-cell receptor CD22-like [Nerophis ophidion]|uniref:B-cell receptor CD22-like n=1 Tax=Nerophis ophidion TaxID=159077 RepID=UPI002ADFA9C3|nr:B-cell receptor CD22-like [Nerophis ophidion]